MRHNFAARMFAGLAAVLFLVYFPSAVGQVEDAFRPVRQSADPSVSILIDVDEKRIYLLEDGKYFDSFLCATGKSDTPSPLGLFEISSKHLWGEGFGGYYLGISCPWGQYGIHGTTNPDSIGSAASHGCFRMYDNDIRKLYGAVRVGTPVLIEKGCYGTFGSGYRQIGPGSYGLDVQAVQKRLRELGFYKGACSGRYDAAGFLSAVHRYEKANGLQISDVIGRKFYASLGFVLIE